MFPQRERANLPSSKDYPEESKVNNVWSTKFSVFKGYLLYASAHSNHMKHLPLEADRLLDISIPVCFTETLLFFFFFKRLFMRVLGSGFVLFQSKDHF